MSDKENYQKKQRERVRRSQMVKPEMESKSKQRENRGEKRWCEKEEGQGVKEKSNQGKSFKDEYLVR